MWPRYLSAFASTRLIHKQINTAELNYSKINYSDSKTEYISRWANMHNYMHSALVEYNVLAILDILLKVYLLQLNSQIKAVFKDWTKRKVMYL